MAPRTSSVAAHTLAATQADISIAKVRLESLRTQAQRLAADVDALLSSPPFTAREDARRDTE
jgi:hypothetical protein